MGQGNGRTICASLPRTVITTTAALLILTSIWCHPADAELVGVNFSLIPTAQYIYWDQDVGLKDDALYGPRVAVNFGRSLSLQGYYLANSSLATDLGAISLGDSSAAPLEDQSLSLKNMGVDVVFNLGSGDVVPFVRGGGGVFRFEPNRGNDFDQIGFKLGTGVRFKLLDRLRTQVFVEDNMVRLNRSALGASDDGKSSLVADPNSNELRHNLAVGIGVNFLLGGYESDEETNLDRAIRSRFESGLFGASWPMEAFAGTLTFDRNAGLEDQNIAGIRTGVNFGQLVGLRGYYWRGMNDGFDDTEPIQSWGGEAQFNLTTGQGAIPYLVVGAGEVDFLHDYRDVSGATRSDKASLILGGGLGFMIGSNLRVNASARDYIFSEGDPDQIARPDELLHNWSYAGGITFLFGKGRATDAEIDAMGRERWRAAEDRRSGEVDSGASTTPRVASAPEQEERTKTLSSDRFITIPAPAVGEIYIRYGEPEAPRLVWHGEPPVSPPPVATQKGDSSLSVGTTASALREIIREELRSAATGSPEVTTPAPEAPVNPAATGVLEEDARMQLLERRITDRVTERLERQIADARATGAPESPAQTIVLPPAQSTVVTEGGSSQGTIVRTGGPSWKLVNVQTFTGINVDYPEQWVLGGRLDVGPISGQSPIRLVPEIALGTFNAGSFMIVANAQHTFGQLEPKGALRPYVFGGLGLLRFGKGVDRDRTEGVFNLGYGVARHFGKWIGFVEHQGVDLYSLHRLNVGIRWTR